MRPGARFSAVERGTSAGALRVQAGRKAGATSPARSLQLAATRLDDHRPAGRKVNVSEGSWIRAQSPVPCRSAINRRDQPGRWSPHPTQVLADRGREERGGLWQLGPSGVRAGRALSCSGVHRACGAPRRLLWSERGCIVHALHPGRFLWAVSSGASVQAPPTSGRPSRREAGLHARHDRWTSRPASEACADRALRRPWARASRSTDRPPLPPRRGQLLRDSERAERPAPGAL